MPIRQQAGSPTTLYRPLRMLDHTNFSVGPFHTDVSSPAAATISEQKASPKSPPVADGGKKNSKVLSVTPIDMNKMLLDERTRVERECELKCQTLAAQWSQRAQQREREVAELRENFLKDSQQSTRLHEQERALLRAREREWQRERDLILEAADHDREDLLRQQKLSLATEERLDAAERRGKEREEVIVVVCECVQMCVCVSVCV